MEQKLLKIQMCNSTDKTRAKPSKKANPKQHKHFPEPPGVQTFNSEIFCWKGRKHFTLTCSTIHYVFFSQFMNDQHITVGIICGSFFSPSC